MKSFFKMSLLGALLLAGVKVSCANGNAQRSLTQEELDRASTNLAAALNIGLLTGGFSAATGALGHAVALHSGAGSGTALVFSGITMTCGAMAMREARKDAITQLLGQEYAPVAAMSALVSAATLYAAYYGFIGSGLIDKYNKRH
jgi:hypothetical protein